MSLLSITKSLSCTFSEVGSMHLEKQIPKQASNLPATKLITQGSNAVKTVSKKVLSENVVNHLTDISKHTIGAGVNVVKTSVNVVKTSVNVVKTIVVQNSKTMIGIGVVTTIAYGIYCYWYKSAPLPSQKAIKDMEKTTEETEIIASRVLKATDDLEELKKEVKKLSDEKNTLESSLKVSTETLQKQSEILKKCYKAFIQMALKNKDYTKTLLEKDCKVEIVASYKKVIEWYSKQPSNEQQSSEKEFLEDLKEILKKL